MLETLGMKKKVWEIDVKRKDRKGILPETYEPLFSLHRTKKILVRYEPLESSSSTIVPVDARDIAWQC